MDNIDEAYNAIADFQESDDYNSLFGRFAIRSVNDKKKYKVGDKLPNSHVWVDGTKTKELETGTCGIEINDDGNDPDDIEIAIDTASEYNDNKKPHHLLLIYGIKNNSIGDRDQNEIVLADAIVVHVIK